MPLSERRGRRVVQYDELGAPPAKRKIGHVGIEFIREKTLPNYSLPTGHVLFPFSLFACFSSGETFPEKLDNADFGAFGRSRGIIVAKADGENGVRFLAARGRRRVSRVELDGLAAAAEAFAQSSKALARDERVTVKAEGDYAEIFVLEAPTNRLDVFRRDVDGGTVLGEQSEWH